MDTLQPEFIQRGSLLVDCHFETKRVPHVDTPGEKRKTIHLPFSFSLFQPFFLWSFVQPSHRTLSACRLRSAAACGRCLERHDRCVRTSSPVVLVTDCNVQPAWHHKSTALKTNKQTNRKKQTLLFWPSNVSMQRCRVWSSARGGRLLPLWANHLL